MADYNLGTARGVIDIVYKGAGPKQATADMERMKKSSLSTDQALGKLAKGAGVSGLVLVGGLAVATNAAAKFEKRLSAIAAVSGATGSEMDQVRDKALQLGKDTQFSASESATAIEELIKAGLSVKDVLNGAADATVNLAAAGEVSMPEAATIASNAMNQFGLAAKNLPKVADDIAGAANASAIDVSEFGYSLQQVGAVANLAGLDFHDTAVAIAELGNAGIKGSDAGTSLKSMFTRLQPTTQKQIDLFEELGLLTFDNSKAFKVLQENGVKPLGKGTKVLQDQLAQLGAELSGSEVNSAKQIKTTQKLMLSTGTMSNAFYDAQGNLKGLSDIQETLGQSLKGMTKEQKQATLNTLFGSDAIRAAAILAENGAKGYDKMSKSMGKVTAASVAEKRMDNLSGSIEKLKGSAETLGIQLGTVLLPYVRKLVDGAASLLDKFLSLSDSQKKAAVAAIALSGGLLLGVAALIKMVQFAKAAREAFVALRIALLATSVASSAFAASAALLAGLAGVTTQATLLTRVFNLLGKGIRLLAVGFRVLTVAILSNPIGIIIVAIIALIAVFVLLYKKNEAFRNMVNKVWSAIKSAIGSVVDWLTGTALPAIISVWNGIVSGVKSMVGGVVAAWNAVKNATLAVFKAIGAAIGAVIGTIKAIVLGGVAAIGAVWSAFWSTFGGVITAAFKLVIAVIQLHFAIIRLIIGTVLLVLQTLWTAFWNGLVAVVTTVMAAVSAVVSTVFSALQAVISTILGAISSVISTVWNGIKSGTSSAWNAIKSAASGPVNALKGIISSAVNAVRAAVSAAWNGVKSVTGTIWNGLKTTVKTAIDGVVSTLKGIKDKVLAPFAGAASWLLDAGKNIIQGLLNGIEGMIGKVTSKLKHLTSLIPKVKGPERVDKKLLQPAGRWIMEGLDDSLTDGSRTVLQNLAKMNARIPATIDPTMSGSISAAVNIPKTDLTAAANAQLTDAYRNANKDKGFSMVDGQLDISEKGKAWIRGQAREVTAEEQDFNGTLGRMAGSNAY